MPVLKVLLNESGKRRSKTKVHPEAPKYRGAKTNFETKTLSNLNRIIRLWLLRNLRGL